MLLVLQSVTRAGCLVVLGAPDEQINDMGSLLVQLVHPRQVVGSLAREVMRLER